MPDAKLRVDTIIYSTLTGDVSFPVSGIAFSGRPNVEASTGIFTTVLSGAIVVTPTGNFIRVNSEDGNFSVLSGETITGTSLNYLTGVFSVVNGTQINSGIVTFGKGVHNTGSNLEPAIFFSGDSDTGFTKPSSADNSLRLVSSSGYVTAIEESGVSFPSAKSLSWLNESGTNKISLKANDNLSVNSIYSFPAELPSSGQLLKILDSSGNTEWISGSASVSYQEYTSNDTWTKPAGCKVVYVECVGGGAGGEAGPRTSGNLSAGRRGGAGGAGAQSASGFFAAAALSGTVSITVGAGGSGAPSVTGDNVQVPPLSGYVPGAGGYSSFGTYITTMTVSGVSVGGYASTSTGISGVINGFYAAFGGQSGVPSGNPGYAGYLCPGGGGAGGGATSGSVIVAAGRDGGIGFGVLKSSGVTSIVLSGSGGTGGVASGGNGGSGVSLGDGGGGGGAGASGQVGGNGGAGAFPGGGGGGGGSSVNGFDSGAGGAGGAGVVRVYSW